ncbi:MAG TPA: cupin domain-containing protein [Solirubrobacteraceae bacterium]|jgi:uncharacterized cupin superfamily protein|nr:cupin domain-containing protein [Solirubrobacteraceae bacterium]
MPDEPNVLQPEWEAEMPDAPFRARALRAGARAGAQELGATLYELDPGGAISPYHFHHANEELLVVLSGSPEVRTPGGARRVKAGAVLAFPRGQDGAHAVTNPGPEPARMLFISTMHFPDVAEHVDTGALLAITGQAAGLAFPAGSDVPFSEAVLEAMEANGSRAAGDAAEPAS